MIDRDGQRYLTMEEAARQVGVPRPNLYYYCKVWGIVPHRFLPKKTPYLHVTDVERIKEVRSISRDGLRKADLLTIEDAIEIVGVERPQIFVYFKVLGIQPRQFPLCRQNDYLSQEEVQQIKAFRESLIRPGNSRPAKIEREEKGWQSDTHL